MKTTLLTIILLVSVYCQAAHDPEVNPQVTKAFKETFIYAEDVYWRQTINGFKVNFWQGQVNVIAEYDDKGNLLGTTRHYSEKQLPPFIVNKIKKKYPGKTIFLVTEVSSEEDISYYVSLQDNKHLYNIQSDAFGNIHQITRLKRGDI